MMKLNSCDSSDLDTADAQGNWTVATIFFYFGHQALASMQNQGRGSMALEKS